MTESLSTNWLRFFPFFTPDNNQLVFSDSDIKLFNIWLLFLQFCSCSPCLSLPIIVWTTAIAQCGRPMAVVRTSVLVLVWLLPLTVAAEYTCSKNSTVLNSFTFDFLRTFGRAAIIVWKKTYQQPNKVMYFTLASKDTLRNVSIWSICNANSTEAMCVDCLGILFTDIYDLCCQQKASLGYMNMRTVCSVGYTAPDYIIPGWTDPGDLPKEVSVEPEPIHLNAAHTILRTCKLFSICLPVLLFNAFVGMC